MQGTDFDEIAFFGSVERCGSRALLIGRRALVVLGLPVLTADYDFWVHIDDIARFNTAAEPIGEALPSRLESLANRLLSRQEFETAAATPISDQERDTVLELAGWSQRRYPTPAERLAYVRRAYRRWTRSVASRPAPGQG